MEKERFNEFIKQLRLNLDERYAKIREILNEDFCKGNIVNYDKAIRVISKYQDQNEFYDDNKKVAICYNGLPEITFEIILNAIVHNNRITFFLTNHKELNFEIAELFANTLVDVRLPNKYIDVDLNYNEVYLNDNKNLFDEIICIGDYQDYQRLEEYLVIKIKYNNYGTIKIYINIIEHTEEYKRIFDFCKKNGISLETFDDLNDFLRSLRKEDYAIIYENAELVDKIMKLVRSEKIIVNQFPYDSYKFEI